MIIFVYDLTKKVENDDPTGSIIYFHPMWVSELQKKSLCGQLMGSTHFLGETLSKVRFISLQNGKFALRPHGRFMLAVGSDRNIPDSILEYRANLLSSLIELYHGDFNTLYTVYVEKEQKNGFNEKVFCLMESCLPLLQFNGNIFQNMPSLRLPKCASNVYLETNQILQSFLQNKGVLGGSIFYHNKVLATQLPISLTKLLVYSDPYRMKIAESITVAFHVPNGVSLISAYITKRDYTQLVEASRNIPIYFNNCTSSVPNTGPVPFAIKKKIIPSKEGLGSTGGYPMLKSDKSIIFSHIPEEETVGSEAASEQTPKKPFSVSRPTFLPLKFKNLTSRDIIDSGVNSINFDESDSFPNFIGKTSVCSTPLTENKIVPNRNMMSICVTQDVPASVQPGENLSDTNVPEGEPSKETADTNGLFPHLNAVKYTILNNPFMTSKSVRAASMANLDQKQRDETVEHSPSDDTSAEEFKTNRKAQLHQLLCKDYDALKTIADPLYPLVDQRKRAMSFSLFQDFERLRNEHFAEMVEKEQEKKEPKDKGKHMIESQPPSAVANGVGGAIRKSDPIVPELTGTVKSTATTPKDRRSLSLPIKSFNLNDDQHPQRAGNSSTSGGQELFSRRKSTLELTPLMTKLTVLAMNDPESSGVSSWDTTPGCSYNMAMSPQEYIPQRRKSQDISQGAGSQANGSDDDKALVKVELFVCVQQNMTLVLVMQERNSKNQRLVQALFESCVSKFLRIENDIQLAMNINVDGYDKAEGYSLVALDANWDVAKKSGPWSTLELQTTESLHTYFRKTNLVTEVTLKSQESVLYGYQCGMRELFYSQMANAQGGLPPPQDVMGSVPLCAKRRIERDHFALLL
ncbi:AGAP004466-PA-like protein [Anopheles sinensis]|uniref:AGAP004466-PA-like protein n=1 Tax=Anopheles sinensis TaxID=74873 RepID=A0A084VHR4_ANOSI|nr:AGAP004466-PA-like protein [Anopheles sinensis]